MHAELKDLTFEKVNRMLPPILGQSPSCDKLGLRPPRGNSIVPLNLTCVTRTERDTVKWLKTDIYRP